MECDYLPNWSLVVQDSDFPVRIEGDGSGTLFDEKAGRNTRPEHMKDPGATTLAELGLLELMDAEARRQLEKERWEFGIRFKVSEDLAKRIHAYSASVKRGEENVQDERALDAELEVVFWEQINPFLTHPLKRIQ